MFLHYPSVICQLLIFYLIPLWDVLPGNGCSIQGAPLSSSFCMEISTKKDLHIAALRLSVKTKTNYMKIEVADHLTFTHTHTHTLTGW